MGQEIKERALVLVKAFPQPSQKYQETVCCAGITPEGNLVRLYPIRFRHLPLEKRFKRWNVVEYVASRPMADHRPESRHVNEDSILVVQAKVSPEQRVRLWLPHVSESLQALKDENIATGKSLGIVKPDEGSLVFKSRRLSSESADDVELQKTYQAFQQASLLDTPDLKPIAVEYEFSYHFASGGKKHVMKIHDWEVQATLHSYKRDYGEKALEMMHDQYQTRMPENNLHFVMGTMKAHPRQFIIIGLLRSQVSPREASRQPSLL